MDALNKLLPNLDLKTVQAYFAYTELLELAAISQMHGSVLPLVSYGSVAVGFNLATGNSTYGIGLNKQFGGSKLDVHNNEVEPSHFIEVNHDEIDLTSAFAQQLNGVEGILEAL